MKYLMTLYLRDRDGKTLKATQSILDTEAGLTCDVGISVSPYEAMMLMPRVEDISVSIKEQVFTEEHYLRGKKWFTNLGNVDMCNCGELWPCEKAKEQE